MNRRLSAHNRLRFSNKWLIALRDSSFRQYFVRAGSITTGHVLPVYAQQIITAGLAVVILLSVLSPPIRVISDWPVVYGDESLLFLIAIFAIYVYVRHKVRRPQIATIELILFLFIPLTILSIIQGAIFFDVTIVKGDYLDVVRFIKYVIAMLLASSLVSIQKYRQFLFSVMILAIVLSALTGIAQALNLPGVRAFFYDTFFQAYKDPSSPPYHILEAPPVPRWHVYMYKMSAQLVARAVGTIGNPNSFGTLLATGSALIIALLTINKRRTMFGLLLFLLLILWLGMISSASRSSMLIGITVSFLMIAAILLLNQQSISNLNIKKWNKIYHWPMVILASLLISLVIVVSNSSLFSDVRYHISNRLDRLYVNPFTSEGGKGRANAIQAALGDIRKAPVLGIGPGDGDTRTEITDNEPTSIAEKYGIVGLTLYMTFWITALSLSVKVMRLNRQSSRLIGLSMFGIIVTHLFSMWVNVELYDLRRMTLTAIAIGLCVAELRAHNMHSQQSRVT